MSLIEKIKASHLQARKDRDPVGTSLYSTLLGEAMMPGKNWNRDSTDEEVIAVIKKFLKNIQIIPETARTDEHWVEERMLENFLPAQMSEGEIRAFVIEKLPSPMGAIMKELKAIADGRYDGALASRIIKEELAKHA